MERIFKFFGKEYSNINHAAFLLGIFSLLSQILGLFRDRFIAHFIGPSPLLDTYYAAFRIPDLIFISVASLASITVLIPFMVERSEGDGEESRKFISNVFTVFFGALVFVCALVFVLMPYIVHLVAPGFPAVMQAKTVDLSRIMLLSPIFLGLSNLFGSITQMFRKFFIYALSPIFYNLGIIIGIIFLYPYMGIEGLAVGVALGAFMHFGIQAFAASRMGFTPRFLQRVDWRVIRKVVMVSLPRTLGLSLNNLALIAIISFASFLSSGSISIFNLSLNLQSVPLGIIGLSYAVAAFPNLTKSYSAGKIADFKSELRQAANQIIFWSMPIAFLFMVLRAQIVRVILGSNTFSWENTRLVAAALAVFSISIVAQGLIALFARSYYAIGNTKRPLYVNLVSSVSIIIFSYLFLFIFRTYPVFQNFIEILLKVEGIPGTEVLMLPLAYSMGTIINCIILWWCIKRDFMRGEYFVSKTFFQSLAAAFLIGLVSYWGLGTFSPIFGTTTFWGIFLQGFISGMLGIVSGIGLLYLFGNQELRDLARTLRAKFWRTKGLVQDQEGM